MHSFDFSSRKSPLLWRFIGWSFYVLSITVLLLGILYTIWSSILIIQATNKSNIVQAILNFFSLIVEAIGVLYTVMLFKQMGTSSLYPPLESNNLNEEREYSDNLPMVSILIPIYQPKIRVLKETLSSVSKINYPPSKVQIIVGDDSNYNNGEREIVERLVKEFNAIYIYDSANRHFKAGMLNIMLNYVHGKYIVFLDYDHIIMPDFVIKAVKLLEEHNSLAFVQGKVNFREVRYYQQKWEAVLYAQFYEVFQRAKMWRHTVLFNGSTGCFRKAVIDEIGGIPFATFTEDVDLSLHILTRGYKSALIDEYGSFGLVPVSFAVLLSQIMRWAKGSMHVLKLRWKDILTSKLPLIDRIDLFFNSSVFFIAASIYVTLVFYILMFFTHSAVIRLPIHSFPPLIIMPLALSLSYQLSSVIALIFAKKSGLKYISTFDLVLFYLVALVLNPFTVYAATVSIFRKRPPEKGKDEWNKKIPYLIMSAIISLIGIGTAIIAYIDFLASGTLWIVLAILALSMIGTFPVCLFFHFYTRNKV